MTINIMEMWDYFKPEVSEQRLRESLASAGDDDSLILQTQIARTHGIRCDFEQARHIRAGLEPEVQHAGTEARVYYYIELWRSYASAMHPPDSLTEETRERTRPAYMRAFELARQAGLDYLAIDALHMMTLVDASPEGQLDWNQKAVAFMQASSKPKACKWEASLHNNKGYALHLLRRYEKALSEFELALAAYQAQGEANRIRIAHWMIAWTLRAMGHRDEAIKIQLRLEKEWDEAGQPDPYVFEELELLYHIQQNHDRVEFYAARRNYSG